MPGAHVRIPFGDLEAVTAPISVSSFGFCGSRGRRVLLFDSTSAGSLNHRTQKLKMKTVSGNVISSKPISLSKATATLSTFVSTDTGASQAINAYLRRTLASFKELKQLHKELKTPRVERKRKRHISEAVVYGEMTTSENQTQSMDATQELSQVSVPKQKKHRKEKNTRN